MLRFWIQNLNLVFVNSLLQFLYKHNHWLLFIALEVVCVVLLFSYNSYQGSVYLSTANAVSARLLRGQDKVTSYFGLAAKNKALVAQNAALQERIFALEAISSQHLLDSLSKEEALQRVHRTGYRITPAQVIDKSVNRTDNYITLDRGIADGVEPDMGVMGIDGIVGVVYKCTEHYSLVMPLLNSKSTVSCKVQGSDLGYLQWEGGDPRYAMLHDLPRYADVAVGDTIVTSGNSSFFPEGLMVGVVNELYPSSDGLYIALKVELATQFARLEHAFVLGRMDADELDALKELLYPKKDKKKKG